MHRQIFSFLVLIACFGIAAMAAEAKKIPFQVTSDPPGATVELNGRTWGTTPLHVEIEDWMVQGKGRWIWSKFLNEPITLTITKEGYFPKSDLITTGPHQWVSGDRKSVQYFYVARSSSIHVKLEKKVEFSSTNPFAAAGPAPASPPTQPLITTAAAAPTPTLISVVMNTEQVVAFATPSVVTVRTATGFGTGFFITGTGVVVTNRHVIDGNNTAKVILSNGQSLDSVSIYLHPGRDLALIKIEGSNFPYLRLANPSEIRAGADVIAIGSPSTRGDNPNPLAGSVTRGIVSAFRDAGSDGVYIQTDVAINSGNSGGPLLNLRGEVVGVNTWKFVDRGVEGLNFAILSSEVLGMLKEHFNYVPSYGPPAGVQAATVPQPVQGGVVPPAASDEARLSAGAAAIEKVAVRITSEPGGAEIYVDDALVGSTPSSVPLAPGAHSIRVTRPGFADWNRMVHVEAGGVINFNAILVKAAPR